MVKYKVVLVPFPFDDFSAIKVRPAVCLTNEIGDHDHIVIAFISSKIPGKLLTTDILLTRREKEFIKAGLKEDSVIRIHKLVTIPKNLIRRELGIIEGSIKSAIHERIKKLFGF
ncbi:MAG: type II toxin-antitoxin system PemK/MazF family toxin [Chitinophagales bacterium]